MRAGISSRRPPHIFGLSRDGWSARFILLVRNPFDAYAASKPHDPGILDETASAHHDPRAFGEHWSRLSPQFHGLATDARCLLVRYEALQESMPAVRTHTRVADIAPTDEPTVDPGPAGRRGSTTSRAPNDTVRGRLAFTEITRTPSFLRHITVPTPKRHPIPIGIYALVASVSIVFAFIGAFDRARTGMYLGTAALTLLLTYAAYLAVPMLERPDRRLAGTVALAAMTLIWGALVFLVWNAHFGWIQAQAAEKVGVSLTFMTMTVLPVVHASLRLKRPRWQASAWVQLIGFGAIGIFATASIWAEWQGEVVVTTIFATACATILIAMLQARSRMPWWARHGMSLIALAASLTWLRLFLGTYDPASAFSWDPSVETLEFLTGCMLTGYALALIFGSLNLFLMPPVSNREWLRWTSFALVAITVALFTAFLFDVGAAIWSVGVQAGSSEALLLLRLGFASGIVSIALTLLYLSLLRLNITDDGMEKTASLAITCPRCRRPTELQTGHQTCPHCELAFRIFFDRPGCRRCGHGVDPETSDRCTECGTPIFVAAT